MTRSNTWCPRINRPVKATKCVVTRNNESSHSKKSAALIFLHIEIVVTVFLWHGCTLQFPIFCRTVWIWRPCKSTCHIQIYHGKSINAQPIIPKLYFVIILPFTALTTLVRWQKGHLAYEWWTVRNSARKTSQTSLTWSGSGKQDQWLTTKAVLTHFLFIPQDVKKHSQS